MGRLEAVFSVLILALMVMLVVNGCSDNTCKPSICGPKPTLENIWPNDDQRFWEYEYTMRGWSGGLCDTLYETREEVPPAPSLDYIVGLLDDHPIGDDVNTQTGIYRMRFDGDSSNSFGVTAQALKDTAYFAGLAISQDSGGAMRSIILGRAMPDERGPWDEIAGSLHMTDIITSYPLLIHGGIWEKNDAWIGTYCVVDTNLCWKFLEDDLAPGSEFTHQLIPSLSNDAVMHCRVLRIAEFRIGGEVYPNALECVYLVDYGPFAYTTEVGGTLGWCRNYDYGVVIYAPEVGPVYSYERALVEAGNDQSAGVGDKTLILTDTGT